MYRVRLVCAAVDIWDNRDSHLLFPGFGRKLKMVILRVMLFATIVIQSVSCERRNAAPPTYGDITSAAYINNHVGGRIAASREQTARISLAMKSLKRREHHDFDAVAEYLEVIESGGAKTTLIVYDSGLDMAFWCDGAWYNCLELATIVRELRDQLRNQGRKSGTEIRDGQKSGNRGNQEKSGTRNR